MKHKVLAILLCLAMVLTMGLPGTLAVSIDEDGSESLMTTEACTCGAEDDNHAEDCPLYVAPKEDPICTCNTENDIHAEDCPLYEELKVETVTETVEVVIDGVVDCAPPFTTAGPLIEYGTAALTPLALYSTYATYGNVLALETADLNDAGGSRTKELELNKTVTANEDEEGTFNITLEAYATGSSITTFVKDGVDIVLMLDLSNYMGKLTTNQITDTEHNYTQVSSYTLLSNLDLNTDYYYMDDNEYYKVVINVSSSNYSSSYTITYEKNGVQETIVNNKNGYTLLSRAGEDNSSVELFTRETNTTTKTETFYDTANPEKLNALKAAVNNFIDKVKEQAPASRIAIVTFADTANVKSGDTTATDQALVTVNDEGVAALKTIVNGLTIQGGASNSHYAAADAVKIFQAVPTASNEYKRQRVAVLFSAGIPGTGWDRTDDLTGGKDIAQATMHLSTILKTQKGGTVTLSTGSNFDGGHTWNENAIQLLLGSSADIRIGCGATFYSVGLDIPTSGDPATVNMKDDPYKDGARSNEYFWRISSHRLDGSHITSPSDLGTNGQSVYDNRLSGTSYGSYYYFYPDNLTRNQENGYYLTTTSGNAADLERLNDIFKGIAGQIVTDSSASTTLDSSTVIKDIMSKQFKLPDNVSMDDIELKTYKFKSLNGTEYVFEQTGEEARGVTAAIDKSTNTVSVTGFDFSENWCGIVTDQDNKQTPHGYKLVITFKVLPKDRFLGGNNVITNAPKSGIYKNKDETEPIDVFPQPEANVTIKNDNTQIESNVYLGGYYGQTLTGEQIKQNTTITIGGENGVTLDLTKDDYGLEDWQTEYVDIVVTITDKAGNVYNDSQLTDDLEYTVTVTIKPKKDKDGTGAAGTPNNMNGKDTTASGKIHVFKPELTYRDSEVWYGDTAPASYDSNLTQTRWVHYGADGNVDKDDETDGVTMLDKNRPTLTITYTPEADKIVDNKIATKQDIAVDVTVKIGDWDVTDYVKFIHTKCSDDSTCTDPTNDKFWLHVNTCQLTITKTGGANNESYVFDVYKDGAKYTEVTIWGNGSETIYELPVGKYTIQENTGWSWRYNANNGSEATLSAKNAFGNITCTNTSKTNQWLNGFSTIVKNIFGVKPEQTSN